MNTKSRPVIKIPVPTTEKEWGLFEAKCIVYTMMGFFVELDEL